VRGPEWGQIGENVVVVNVCMDDVEEHVDV
jgi:hypothetical protein